MTLNPHEATSNSGMLLGAPDHPLSAEQQRAALGGAASVRDTWIAFLAPHFAGNDSCYFTGTYSDDYGIPNGLMAQRNVLKDWTRWLDSWGFGGKFIIGIEKHRWRDVLHLHAIIEGKLSPEQMRFLQRWWAADRGHARALPVLDGCASYITKYALKGDTDAFEWRL
jgi:hypothetical protein